MEETKAALDAARAKVRELAQRLSDDPGYRQQIETDPHAALREAGIPEEVHGDFMREAGIEAEVSGYRGCDCGSCCFSCVYTTW